MFQSEVKEFPCRRGKVRDVYEVNKNRLVIVTTDRVSAFDWVLPNTIPDRGCILTAITQFWLEMLEKGNLRHHLIATDINKMPEPFHRQEFEGRIMLVEKCDPIPVECIVRGYITGSGWKDYKNSGSISGVRLPASLQENMCLPEPIFTPTTKVEKGHDEAIDMKQMREIVNDDNTCKWLKDCSREIYQKASAYAWERGIIIADTKFEFGKLDHKIYLIDEVFTPDSSRYWPVEEYGLNKSIQSLDKQFIRNYLDSSGWDKESAPPELPKYVVEKTRAKYVEIYERLTDKKWR